MLFNSECERQLQNESNSGTVNSTLSPLIVACMSLLALKFESLIGYMLVLALKFDSLIHVRLNFEYPS